jgi:hypothetical protein
MEAIIIIAGITHPGIGIRNEVKKAAASQIANLNIS